MWDIKCIAAAMCFATSNILFAVHTSRLLLRPNLTDDDEEEGTSSIELWKELNPTHIQGQWARMSEERPIMASASLLNVVAWFLMIGPLLQSAWVLSRGGRRLVGPHVLLAMLAVCGGLVELLARLFYVGMMNAAQWLARDFNLDDWGGNAEGIGWRVLEMIHVVTRGMLLWIDAFESLALFGIFALLFYSVTTETALVKRELASKRSTATENSIMKDVFETSSECEDPEESASTPPQAAFQAVPERSTPSSESTGIVKPSFTKRFVYFGLFVGNIALLDFFAEVFRFFNWRVFGRLTMFTNIIMGGLLFPIWLLCLAWQLPGATVRFETVEHGARVLLEKRAK
mmetsp:Transcript_14434/g.29831  ORF Transcript_14434/g.29831 Transcript_14434/m.29831 type:complete len:344 (+) Transcript_14434:100-1131(+)